MPELGPYGFVRGARGNSRPYRDPGPGADIRDANVACRDAGISLQNYAMSC
jgi:hypothetical protein